jgi:segregation and condensation protein A
MPSLYPIQLPIFEGPLDLLLRLIEREELDVTTVALAQVADQYLARLAEMEQRKVKDLADFLVVAAKLLLIKSTALLPTPQKSEPESKAKEAGQELVRQLQIYKRFKEIASQLQAREEKGLRSHIRLASSPPRDPQPDLGDVTLQDILALAQEALDVRTGPSVSKVVSPVTVTINEQVDLIERQLAHRQRLLFRRLISRSASRIEIIVTLLAVLELIKQDRVQVRQGRLFGEIVIMRPAWSGSDATTSPAA